MDRQDAEDYMVDSQIAGQVGQAAAGAAAAQYYVEEHEKTLAEAQLECDRILDKVRHMIRQDLKKYKPDGTFEWIAKKEEDRMLTDLGVERIMQTMEAYVNKESLLSNYDEKIINRRMLEYSYALNGNIFMKYELYFRLPTIEESKKIIEDRLKEKIDLKVFAQELAGLNKSREEIKIELLKETEFIIEEEIARVREEKKLQNLREYELLFTELRAIVESVHHRAFRGGREGKS